MAKKKTSKIWIGLFVIIGSVIGAGSIVWLGASKCFEGGKSYVPISMNPSRVCTPIPA